MNLDAWYIQYKRCLHTMSMMNKQFLSGINHQLSDVLQKNNLSDKRQLLVCSSCPGNKVFDPGHVPMWARCSHPGCCTKDMPCCRKHVSNCFYCHEPVCHYHLKHSDIHKNECQRTLSSRCGYGAVLWFGYSIQEPIKSLDPYLCGKLLSSANGEVAGMKCVRCSVLCCNDCFVPCSGWRQKCRCKVKCEGLGGKCSFGSVQCENATGWCKVCFYDTDNVYAKCEKCYDDEMEDDTDDDTSSSEEDDSDSELVREDVNSPARDYW